MKEEGRKKPGTEISIRIRTGSILFLLPSSLLLPFVSSCCEGEREGENLSTSINVLLPRKKWFVFLHFLHSSSHSSFLFLSLSLAVLTIVENQKKKEKLERERERVRKKSPLLLIFRNRKERKEVSLRLISSLLTIQLLWGSSSWWVFLLRYWEEREKKEIREKKEGKRKKKRTKKK